MDPKKASQLDPTLQAAYDRVMGVATSTPSDLTQTPVTLVAPTANPTPATSFDPSTPATPMPDPTNTSSNSGSSMPQMPIETPTDIPPVAPVESPQPSISTPPPTEIPTTPVVEQTVQTPMATVESTVTMKPHAFVAKNEGKKAKISPVIWVIGAIAFLLVYTIVCIKIFNLSVPYINQ